MACWTAMIHSSCGTATLVNLLSIFFLLTFFFPGVDAASNFDLESRCPIISPAATPWWQPLRDPIFFNRDPCQVHQFLRNSKHFTLDCCFSPTPGQTQNQTKRDGGKDKDNDSHDGSGSGGGLCGPCNLQTYNIAAACKACERALNSTTPSENELGFMPLSSWQTNDQGVHVPGFPIPWMNTPATVPADMFDAQQAVRTANNRSTPPKLPVVPSGGANPTSPTIASATSTSIISATASASSSRVRAGAIAGGVIAGVLFLALVALGVILYLCRKRRRRSAPSSAFAPVSGPPAAHEDPPPKFDPGSWRPTPLKKWDSAATATSRHGLMSNTAWSRDIEKH